jgi:O-antigen ligase
MSLLASTKPLTLKLETSLIFLLGFAIFISKPLIYFSTLLLIFTLAARLITDQPYRHALFDNRLFWASVGVFLLGVVSTSIGSDYPKDVAWMVRKTMILVLMAPLVLAFGDKTNRLAGLLGVLLGFWLAFVLTADMYNWGWSGGRYEGATWDVGMWGVVCAMLMTFLTPLLFAGSNGWGWRVVVVTTIMAAAFMLITTLTRGPWLGVAAGVLIYMIMKQRKALLIFTVALASIFYTAKGIWPDQEASFESRVESISNTQGDESNFIRLALWEAGSELMKKQFVEADKRFWFGNGATGKDVVANDFFYKEFKDKATVKPGELEAMGWHVGDMHNMYIDSMLANGFLWTLSCLVLLIWFALKNRSGVVIGDSSWFLPPLLICYLVIGLTYAILPHFALMICIYFISLLNGMDIEARHKE